MSNVLKQSLSEGKIVRPPNDGRRLRVGVVDEELPFPRNSGKRIRTLGLLGRLAKCHDITLIAHRNSEPTELLPAIAHLNELGIRVVVVDRTVPTKSGIGFYARLAGNLFSSLPYSVATHASEEMKSVIRDHVSRSEFDLWHCEWTPYAEIFRSLDCGPLVVTAHNIESQIWQRYYETAASMAKRWYIGKQWQKFQAFERWAFGRAKCTIAVSFEDSNLAARQFGAERLDVVENGVDTDYFRPAEHRTNPRHLIMVGSLDWRPNIDGVERFLSIVFPQILRAEPLVRLSIVGRNPSAHLARQVAAVPQAELHANVPDVRPYLAQAGILVVPLRVGGGSRLKILEAAASGLPVVSTRIGAEGLTLVDGQHYTSAESVDEMCDPILRTIRNYARALDYAAAARELVCQRYDWQVLAAKLDQIWQECSVAV